jgi:N-acetylglucosamine-6-phosphate deacetylase
MEGMATLAGATLPLVQCIGKAVNMTGLSLAEVLTMATVNPGRFVGGRGVLQMGMRADFIRFRWTGEVAIQEVWLGGELIPNGGPAPYLV